MRLLLRTAAGICLALFVCVPASARGDRPEGIPAGPWLLSPWLRSSYEFESNVLLQEEGEEEDSRVTKFEGGFQAELPFRNSGLEFKYQAAKRDYSNAIFDEFERDTSQTAEVKLELNFGSSDRLTLKDTYREDFTRVDQDLSSEISFVGEPYDINRLEVELRRDHRERPGYVVRIRHVNFTYEGATSIGFFDYRGFDYRLEYRHPLPAGKHFVVTYNPRRFDHFKPEGILVPGLPSGAKSGAETTDNLTVGFGGSLGEEQPYRIELGYGRSIYDKYGVSGEVKTEESVELVGSATWEVRIGGRSGVDLELTRRSLPSIVSSYYINNGLRADFYREWLDFQGGVELDWTLNSYGVPENCGGTGPAFRREDNTLGAELYWDWKIHDRFRFEISSFYEKRNSNCDIEDYDAKGISAGVRLGWF